MSKEAEADGEVDDEDDTGELLSVYNYFQWREQHEQFAAQSYCGVPGMYETEISILHILR